MGQLDTLTVEMGEEIERLQQHHQYAHSDDEDEGSGDPYRKYHHRPGTESQTIRFYSISSSVFPMEFRFTMSILRSD